jgi:hypothetical protein
VQFASRASMASTGAYAGGDYGRGDGDARVNRAPPPAQGMTASKDEVEEALPPKEVMDKPVTPPSVQVIRRPPGKVSREEAVAYAETVLPIHGGHAAGCKVCFYGPCQIPCPACIYVIPCRTGEPRDEPGCICPIIFCFGAPLPPWVSSGCGKTDRGPGESWIFRDEKGRESCQCIVVDKEEGIINCYPTAGHCSLELCFGHCSLVPIAKVGQLSVCK